MTISQIEEYNKDLIRKEERERILKIIDKLEVNDEEMLFLNDVVKAIKKQSVKEDD